MFEPSTFSNRISFRFQSINFMKQDAPVNKESDVYKAIIEEEAAKSQKRSGQFGNQYGVPQSQSSPAPSVTPQQANQTADLNPSYRVDDLPRTSPTLQSQSFKRLQHILGDGTACPSSYSQMKAQKVQSELF